jgi:hypothetical protein
MAKLVLSKNEFTVDSLLQKVKSLYVNKSNGVPFSKADIHDWANKGRIPKAYGGQFLKIQKIGPLKVLELSIEPFNNNSETSLKIEKEK